MASIIAALAFILATTMSWLLLYWRYRRSINRCIYCGKVVDTGIAFCSSACRSKASSTGFQRAIIRHKIRERKFLVDENIRKYGKLIGQLLPVDEYKTPVMAYREWKIILKLFNFSCAYCGRKDVHLTYEHIIPVSNGGKFEKGNIIPACQSCNSRKGTKDLTVFYKRATIDKDRRKRIERFMRKYHAN